MSKRQSHWGTEQIELLVLLALCGSIPPHGSLHGDFQLASSTGHNMFVYCNRHHEASATRGLGSTTYGLAVVVRFDR